MCPRHGSCSVSDHAKACASAPENVRSDKRKTLGSFHKKMRRTLHTLHSKLCTPHITFQILHFARCIELIGSTLQIHVYIPHFPICTFHSPFHSLHSTFHIPHFALHTSCSTAQFTSFCPEVRICASLQFSHSLHYTLHFAIYTSHFTLSTPHS